MPRKKYNPIIKDLFEDNDIQEIPLGDFQNNISYLIHNISENTIKTFFFLVNLHFHFPFFSTSPKNIFFSFYFQY